MNTGDQSCICFALKGRKQRKQSRFLSPFLLTSNHITIQKNETCETPIGHIKINKHPQRQSSLFFFLKCLKEILLNSFQPLFQFRFIIICPPQQVGHCYSKSPTKSPDFKSGSITTNLHGNNITTYLHGNNMVITATYLF